MNRKPRLLVVTPRPPIRGVLGDTLRSRFLLDGLAEHYELTILTLAAKPLTAEERTDLELIATELIVYPRNRIKSAIGALAHLAAGKAAQVGWLHSPTLLREVEQLVVGGGYAAAFVQLARFSGIERVLGDLPLVLDFVDALSLQWERRAERGGLAGVFDRLEAARMRQAERDLMRRAEVSIAAAPDDGRHLMRLLPERIDLRVIRNGVSLPEREGDIGTAARGKAPVLVFSGNLDYFPNAHALRWFSAEVLPLLKKRRPDLRFLAAGKVTSEEVQALAQSHGVEFTGFVPDMGEVLADADIAIATMQSGAGIQNKVLEAMAVGTPVVATRLGNAGIQAVHGREILIASAPDRVAARIESLLDNPELYGTIARGGLDLVNRDYRWRASVDRLVLAIDEAVVLRSGERNEMIAESEPTRSRSRFVTVMSGVLGKALRSLDELLFTGLRKLLLVCVVGGLLLSILALPLVALAMSLLSPGPLFYSQERVGEDRRNRDTNREGEERRLTNLGGRPFTIWKLRSMIVDSERSSGPVWATRDDPRITPFGSFLRKLRLDELPQLWNILRGDMNLIGPRPERSAIVRDLMREIPGYNRRMTGIKPGVTGLAQVRGGYDNSLKSVRAKLLYDLAYKAHTIRAREHFLMDLRVLLATVPTVLFRKGAR
ncbi:MAG: glycosyltransferase [bacterium]|nr:glycosyltransferase [bacterium]